MARKNFLANVTSPVATDEAHQARSGYALRGASRSMKLSIDELAANAKRVVAGDSIVELDPTLVDPSALKDRIEDDDEEFILFRDGIRETGQPQSILVRPNDQIPGRYIIVFGHRRARAARELGRPVLAVVKRMDEVAHVIAQGQENTRRKDYSFIEKALFARRLTQMGHSKDVAKASLSVDDTLFVADALSHGGYSVGRCRRNWRGSDDRARSLGRPQEVVQRPEASGPGARNRRFGRIRGGRQCREVQSSLEEAQGWRNRPA